MAIFRKGRQWRFHGLKRPKIRQDWNKHTLYNLSRLTTQPTATRTFFQQKWTAKAMTRAYHAEQMNEKKWERLFDRRVPAVVPVEAKALATDDGSHYSAGRGSGLQDTGKVRLKQEIMQNMTPYMQMVYHPTERRLDTAIFRALFASSARQARQFVVHGHVKVNGKRMIYPGYMLNPGDMFQVEPEHVLECTARELLDPVKKRPVSRKKLDVEIRAKNVRNTLLARRQAANRKRRAQKLADLAAWERENDPHDEPAVQDAEPDETDPLKETKTTLLDLRKRAIELEENPPKGVRLSGKKKEALRTFRKTLKSKLSRAADLLAEDVENLKSQWQSLRNRLTENDAATGQSEAGSKTVSGAGETDGAASSPSPSGKTGEQDDLAEEDVDVELEEELLWEPKAYMSAFAFIPKYLEVNHAICSAVYLRHPVVKPGLAEVPTPFHPETGQLAFNWYLRRR